jgi:hypothetical protein
MPYWFKPKRYGYGATPVTWQGWLLTIAAVAATAVSVFKLLQAPAHPLQVAAWLALMAFSVAVLVIVSRRKTDGEWRWRWGNRS